MMKSRQEKQKQQHKVNTKTIVIVIILLVSVAANFFLYNQILKDDSEIKILNSNIGQLSSIINDLQSQITGKESTIKTLSERLGIAQTELDVLTPRIKSYYAAGVGPDGKGTITPIQVKLLNGTGAISVNINNVDLLEGVQESVRTAANVAESYTGISLTNKDIVVSFINDQPYIVTIDGPSAGVAITTTIIAAIENKTMNTNVLMTGTINDDGSVGKVGGVPAKALAARDFGAESFLVPKGQYVFVDGLAVREINNITDAINQVLE